MGAAHVRLPVLFSVSCTACTNTDSRDTFSHHEHVENSLSVGQVSVTATAPVVGPVQQGLHVCHGQVLDIQPLQQLLPLQRRQLRGHGCCLRMKVPWEILSDDKVVHFVAGVGATTLTMVQGIGIGGSIS